MPRLTIVYPHREGGRFDFDYYLTHHMPMVADRLGDVLDRWEVFAGTRDFAGGEHPVAVATCHLYFEDIGRFAARMREVGGELMADLPNFTDLAPTMTVEEHRAAS